MIFFIYKESEFKKKVFFLFFFWGGGGEGDGGEEGARVNEFFLTRWLRWWRAVSV